MILGDRVKSLLWGSPIYILSKLLEGILSCFFLGQYPMIKKAILAIIV